MAIRMATEQDIPRILAVYGPYVETTCISFEYTVPTREEFTRRFTSYTARFPWLVWEEDGQILGYAYGSAPWTRAAYGWSAEASVYVAPQAHRRGIGRALYEALEKLIFAQGYRVIYCLITTDNPGCRETVLDGESGLIYPGGNVDRLCACIERFLETPNATRKAMGERGRRYIEENFSRTIVVGAYLEKIKYLIHK